MSAENELGPLLRIAQVAEATGVPEVTLRAWERRYGVPTPARTEGGYRLFGSRELAQVREMRRLLDQGTTASEAARIVRARNESPAERAPRPEDHAKDAILDAVVRFDPVALDLHLRTLLFRGPIIETLDNVVVPTLRRIGDLWHSGAISVAHEHFASAQLGMVMRDFLRLITPSAPRGAALLACFEHDHHELGLLATAIRLGGWGIKSVVLGASTPADGLGAAVSALRPDLVALSCTVAPPTRAARRLVDEYAAAAGASPWVVGGTGARALAPQIEQRGGFVPRNPEELKGARRIVGGEGAVRRRGGEVAPAPSLVAHEAADGSHVPRV